MSGSPPNDSKAEPETVLPATDFIPIVHHNMFMRGRTLIKCFPADRADEAMAFLESERRVGAPAYVGSPVPPGVWDAEPTGETVGSPDQAQGRPKVRVEGSIIVTPASLIEPSTPSFLIPGLVPERALTILGADPGIGKSMLAMHWAASLTGGRLSVPKAPALILNAEDSASDTTVPRLVGAGADLSLVQVLTATDPLSPLVLPEAVPELARLVEQTGARLLIIDPVNNHFDSRKDNHRDPDVRQVLAPVAEMAQRLDIAVLALMHLTKLDGAGEALHRILGSVGHTGLARSVILMTRDPDDPEGDLGCRRVLSHGKCNVAKLAGSQVYEIEDYRLSDGTETSRLVGMGSSPYSARECLELTRRSRPRPIKGERATALIDELLPPGTSRPVKEIEDRSKAEGISWATMDRARKELGIVPRRVGLSWKWSRPTEDTQDSDDR